jgi:hypothetical protein
VFGKLTVSPESIRDDRRQSGVEYTESHGLLGRLDDVHAARVGALAARGSGCLRAGELGKPRPDRRQHAHEAARAHQGAARATAFGQIGVESLLLDFVHVQKTVGRARLDGRIFDVLP